MTTLEILFLLGLVGALPAILLLAFSRRMPENAVLVGLLAAGFWLFSIVTIAREGLLGFIPNHVQSLWGTQVWYDLVICLVVALVFIVPRARAVGMNIPLWVLACGCSASLALLPMVARLFWLEQAARRQG